MRNPFRRIDKVRALVGIVLAAICFCICHQIGGSVIKSAVLSGCFAVVGCLKKQVPDKLTIPTVAIALGVTGAVALFLSQFVQNEGLASLNDGMLWRGLCCCVVIAGILYLILPSIQFSMIATVVATLTLATANWFVYRFRGSELVPIDFVYVGTAMNVANQYDFQVSTNMVYAWVIFGLFAFSAFGIFTPKVKRRSCTYTSIFVAVIVLCAVFAGSIKNMVPFHYGNGGTYKVGYVLNFVMSARELYVKPPEGYSEENVDRIQAEYLRQDNLSNNQKKPDIIVIMDEAYSDLSVLGDYFKTEVPVSPFIQSLEENTIKGYATSSSYGGRTANSEFEFLTGATLGFVPQGIVAYQQYVKDDTFSLVSVMKSRGYDTIAMHPFLANGWTRDTVWPHLGFDRCYFLDDFPQENLMRGFVSDQEMMEYIINTVEGQESDVPLFLFGVTMQNHSGYDYQGSDFHNMEIVVDYSQEYPSVNQYLTLLNETDKAIEYLLSYLKKAERETLVVFFGDHLPALDNAFYEEVHGGGFESMDEQMLHYMVPFFIWANYDIDEQEVEYTSLGYLSTMLFRAADLELTPYQQFLADVQEVIPAINAEGYYSKEKGAFSLIRDAVGVEKDWLNRYQQIQYEYLTGEPDPLFYGIQELVTEE